MFSEGLQRETVVRPSAHGSADLWKPDGRDINELHFVDQRSDYPGQWDSCA